MTLRLHLTQNIKLSLRKKSNLFSRTFWMGFVLAALLHGILLSVLRIAEPEDPNMLKILKPIAVEVDLGTPEAYAPLAQMIFSPLERIEPPQLLHLSTSMVELERGPLFHSSSPEPDFSELEKFEYQSPFDFEEEEDNS